MSGLARKIVDLGVLDEQVVVKTCQAAGEQEVTFVEQLVAAETIDCLTIATISSQEFGIPLFDLGAMDFELCPISLVDEKLIRRHKTLPLYKRGSILYVAISDPAHLQGLDEIKFHVGMNVEPVLVEHDKLTKAITDLIEAETTRHEGLDDTDLDDIDFSEQDDDLQSASDEDGPDVDDTPIVRFVNKVILDAVNKGASDLHFEPYEHTYRVRFRIDGILQEITSPPSTLAKKIAARIKVMSRLDISERRVPQDGRMKMKLSRNRVIDFRVSTCPTLFGEKVVMRILDPTSAQLGIDALGYDEEQKRLFLEAIHRPYGMVLVTGPTGSGKTVSLYTALNILNTQDRNISTAEDPAEINLPGINQVNVNPKAGLTFAGALKSFLRQDPDIIMIGEIRDLETGEIAVKAAQTGHLVLSTLHTNDAPKTLTRLVNMGVAPFNIASAVNLIIAQRLGRRLCSHCKEPADIPHQALIEEGFRPDEVDKLVIYKAVGCDKCTGGYKGRVGIYQVMPISEAMSKIIMENGNSIQLAEQAKKEGIPDLYQSGLEKVRQGILSLEELHRVIVD
ncbi:MAG: type IV-A pilus assembly ATPase PilB [Gammaproteobacteria bacterium]|nr:type IV-A pilus assembly ATPase PilB [Gammaproteobacteria bacterium]